MSDETSAPPSDDDQPAPAEALAAAMAPPRLQGSDAPTPTAEQLAALLAQPKPGTTIH